ncbi:Ig-like domain-containing protein [Clostridium sp.]|uniref:Ig-like domain-containing protein n=1 Tax=Clostridium sp. TaxID=1506 RepID=UPI003464A923
MKNTIIRKLLSLFLLLVLTLSMMACQAKDKEIVLANDVMEQVKVEEMEVKDSIHRGNKYLEEEKYDEARKAYEEAISMGINNKDTYLEIKNMYMEKKRFDDAYYIIKLAIENNVDIDNMKAILEDIKKNFEEITMENSINERDNYSLPKDVVLNINGKDVKGIVKWESNEVNTSKPGNYIYKGVVEQYGRSVKLTLNVKAKPKEVVKEKKIGYVKEVGKDYIKFDEVEFYMYEDAYREAKKDGELDYDYYNPEGTVYNDYHIRNNNYDLKKYNFSKDIVFKLCKGRVSQSYSNGAETTEVSYEVFKQVADKTDSAYNKNLNIVEKGILCWIYLEDNNVVKIEHQYTP